MSYVIDRRLNGKNKSTVNRQRFLRRYRDHIKKAVEEAVGHRSITDMEHGEQISIPGRDIDEPVLHHGRGGKQTIVHPGNVEEVRGAGVVGQQPLIEPGEQHTYSSGSVLTTQVGTMQGSYLMHAVDDHEFKAIIKPFRLAVPGALH